MEAEAAALVLPSLVDEEAVAGRDEVVAEAAALAPLMDLVPAEARVGSDLGLDAAFVEEVVEEREEEEEEAEPLGALFGTFLSDMGEAVRC